MARGKRKDIPSGRPSPLGPLLSPEHWRLAAEALLEYGLAYLGGTGAFVASAINGTDAEIVGLA